MSSDHLAQLGVWDVLFPHDALIYPPKFKMWVCVSRAKLWFLRINSEPLNAPVVRLRADLHPFLDRDSWLSCGGDLAIILDVELEKAVERQAFPERRGIVGTIHPEVREEVIAGVLASRRLTPFQKKVISRELRGRKKRD